MNGSQDKVWYLKQINLFEELPPADIMRLAELSEMRQVPAKGTLFLPGEVSGAVFFLKTGRIKIARIGPEGRELTLDFLDPGEVFGELAGSDEESSETMAVAVEPSLVCTMSRQAFDDFLATRPALTLRIAKFMGFRLKRIEARLQDLLFLDVRGRILKVLRDLAQDHGVVTPAGVRLNLKLTHEDIANLCGTTRATATTTLGELRESGELAQDGKFFVLPLASTTGAR